MVGLTAASRSQKLLLLLGVFLLAAVFCLSFMGNDLARAQEGDDGGTTEEGGTTGDDTPPMPKPDGDFDPRSWIMGKTGMLIGLAWGLFVVLMVLFILFHSGKMAAGGQMGQVEGKSGVIRVIMAIALGAGGWFITMFIINLF